MPLMLIVVYLKRLYICNNGMSAEAVELISQILLEGRNELPFTLLHFYNNMSGNGGAIALGSYFAHILIESVGGI
jgi:hypothetical protein